MRCIRLTFQYAIFSWHQISRNGNLWWLLWKLRSHFQIIEVLNALETFSVLSECKIEGIESMSSRFNHIYSTLKKKPYDPLDHRRQDFNVDFLEFQRQIKDLQVWIRLCYTCLWRKQSNSLIHIQIKGLINKLFLH